MLRKLHAVSLVFVLAAGLFGFNRTTHPTARAASSAASLLSLLPASDFIAYGDARQVTSVVLPAIFAQKPELKARIDRAFADFQKETGVDPNSFDSVAVGVRFPAQGSRNDPSFVAIARGSFDAATAIDTSIAVQARKINSNRVKATIEYGGQTIYVSARADSNGAKTPNYNDRDLAAVIIDTNTVAVGDLSSMRAVIDAAAGKNRVDDELIALATRTPGALGGFAGNMSGMISDLIIGGHGGGDNEIGKTVSSIKQVYGSVTSAGTDMDAQITLRTDNAEQAHNIGSMINALKLFTKASDNNGRRSPESLLHDVNVSVEGNEVDLTLHASMMDMMQFAHHF
jgi:hypothetical protein